MLLKNDQAFILHLIGARLRSWPAPGMVSGPGNNRAEFKRPGCVWWLMICFPLLLRYDTHSDWGKLHVDHTTQLKSAARLLKAPVDMQYYLKYLENTSDNRSRLTRTRETSHKNPLKLIKSARRRLSFERFLSENCRTRSIRRVGPLQTFCGR